MPTYVIERNIPGAGEMTREEWRDASAQSNKVIAELCGGHRPRQPRRARPMIRRYIAWRNRNARDRALRELVKRANVA